MAAPMAHEQLSSQCQAVPKTLLKVKTPQIELVKWAACDRLKRARGGTRALVSTLCSQCTLKLQLAQCIRAAQASYDTNPK
jgi:hypothetical protein